MNGYWDRTQLIASCHLSAPEGALDEVILVNFFKGASFRHFNSVCVCFYNSGVVTGSG